MTATPWSLRRDERCLRGLKFSYTTAGPWCAECFAEGVGAEFPAGLVAGTEELGPVVVRQLVRPHGFELRWGLRADEIELHHRLLAKPEVRAATHAAVERVLDRIVARGCPRHA